MAGFDEQNAWMDEYRTRVAEEDGASTAPVRGGASSAPAPALRYVAARVAQYDSYSTAGYGSGAGGEREEEDYSDSDAEAAEAEVAAAEAAAHYAMVAARGRSQVRGPGPSAGTSAYSRARPASAPRQRSTRPALMGRGGVDGHERAAHYMGIGRGLHSFKSELNLSNSRTHS